MKKLLILLVLVIFSISLKSQIKGEIVNDSNNLKIVKIWGTHQERGYAYGYLMGNDIGAIFNQYIKPQFGLYYPYARNMIIDGLHLEIDSIFKVEAQSVIEGMNAAGKNSSAIDYVDLLVCNSLLDLFRLLSTPTKVACSTLMSWGDATAGTDLSGKSVITRHLDWLTHNALINNQVMCINIPDEVDEQPWVSVGFAGMLSVLSGFNQNMGVFQNMMDDYLGYSVFNKKFEPIWYSLRKAIEKKDYNKDGHNNTSDVKSVLSDHPQGYAGGYLISALAKSTEIQDDLIAMIAEITPVSPFITYRYNDYSDNIPGDNLYTANSQIARNDSRNYCDRYNSVVTALGTGTVISSTGSWNLMRDHSHLSHNLQFMQFAPEISLFRISVYDNGQPAYLNSSLTFNTNTLLGLSSGLENVSGIQKEIQFYPNPVIDMMTIKGLGEMKKNLDIKVFDLTGRLLIFQSKSNVSDELQMNFSTLSKGTYFIELKYKNEIKSFKVVKN